MKITVTDKALTTLFKGEMGLGEGDGVRFTSRIYGKTEVHEGLSVMMRVEEVRDVLAETTIDGITFFITKDDEWFFHGYDFEVDYDADEDVPLFHFHENDEE